MEVIAIYSMVRLIAILLFGILITNSFIGLYLICRIDKFIENSKKERRADE